MNAKSNQWVLFGFDLSQSLSFLKLALRQLLYDRSSRLIASLQPLLWIRAGERWVGWNAAGAMRSIKHEHLGSLSAANDFFAAVVPHESVLFKPLRLPASVEPYLADTVALEVSVSSPFADEDVIHGYQIVNRDGATIDVLVALSSKQAAEQTLADWRTENAALATAIPSVCAIEADYPPVEFLSYISSRRESVYLKKIRDRLARGAAGIAFIFFVIGLPALSSQYRADRLADELESLRRESVDVNAAIDGLHMQRDRLNHILQSYSDRPDHARWLGDIADKTPDGTYLQLLSVEDAKLEITGYSDNAASYLTLLTEQAAYSNVQAQSAFVRDQRTGLERFTIDWEFAPRSED